MEDVYKQRKYSLLFTEALDLNQIFHNYTELLKPFFKNRKKGESIKALLDISDDAEYVKLKEKMHPDKAKYTLIPKAYIPRRRFIDAWALYHFPSFETSLVTINNLKKETPADKYKRILSSKYKGKIILEPEKNSEDAYRTRTLHPLFDYLVCLRVENLFLKRDGKKYQPSQEFWVPGNMMLERFKDRIVCEEDYALLNPLIDSPHQRDYQRKMDYNNYGMFYIGKDFFIDKRNAKAAEHDYSIEVREWMQSKNIDAGSVKSMNTTRIVDLKLKLGYPYLYMHQGKCEHLITVTDARLVTFPDILFFEDYPLLQSFAAIRGRCCVLCLSRLAKLCVTNCDIIPYETAFICNTCALSYLYDSDGKKKTTFTLYKYIDRSAII